VEEGCATARPFVVVELLNLRAKRGGGGAQAQEH